MYQGKLRKIVIVLLALYTILTLFLLFIGFNRASPDLDQGMRYSLISEGIPLHFPMGRDFQIWFFELGNFAVFIPFGIVIPLLFRYHFIRFISCFILCITILEIFQMISRLGAFDIDDIIINTLGAAVGYGSQRIVTRHRDTFKGMFRIILIAIAMSIGLIAVVGGINHYLDQGGGEAVALNELPLKDGSVQWDENLTGFTAAQTKIEPQINLYNRKNKKNNEFSYLLNSKYIRMEGYVAIPDDVVNSNGRNEITFIADGSEIYSIGLGRAHHPESFQIPLKGVDELTIKFFSEGPNPITTVVMWDIKLTEVNTGQKMINSIRSIF